MWSDYPCKISDSYKDAKGYSFINHDGKQIRESRFVLEQSLGRQIKPGYQACHYCDTPSCIESNHIYEGTPKQNTKDAIERGKHRGWMNAGAARMNRTHCPAGHEYSGSNLYYSQGYQHCRECDRRRSREYQAKRRAVNK